MYVIGFLNEPKHEPGPSTTPYKKANRNCNTRAIAKNIGDNHTNTINAREICFFMVAEELSFVMRSSDMAIRFQPFTFILKL